MHISLHLLLEFSTRNRYLLKMNFLAKSLHQYFANISGIAVILLGLGLPPKILETLLWANGYTPDNVEMMFALVFVILVPLMGAGIALLWKSWQTNERLKPLAVIIEASTYLGPLISLYISISLIVLGWATVCMIPGFILKHFMNVSNPAFFIPFLIPAVVIYCRYFCVVNAVVVLENLHGFQARQRCRELTQKGFNKHLTVVAILIAISTALDYGATPIANEVAKAIPGMLASTYIIVSAIGFLFDGFSLVVFLNIYDSVKSKTTSETPS